MPGRPVRTQLSEDHWKAISLVEEGSMTYKAIAEEMGWNIDYFQDLRDGNTEKAGHIATLFAEEIKKAKDKRDIKTKQLIADNMATAQELLRRILEEYKGKKSIPKDEKKLIGTLTNVLSNCQPNVSIKATSFSYVKGLNPEDLVREFTRLKNIAEQSFNRRGIPETPA